MATEDVQDDINPEADVEVAEAALEPDTVVDTSDQANEAPAASDGTTQTYFFPEQQKSVEAPSLAEAQKLVENE